MKKRYTEEQTIGFLRDRGTVEIDVARNRFGVPGTLRLVFRPELARFENYDWS